MASPRSEPWIVDDELWGLIEPVLPQTPRRFGYPGRKRLDDRPVLQGILFVLHTAIGWEYLPQEPGFGSGMTAWRRLHSWQAAGVWDRLHMVLLDRLQAAGQIDWSRAIVGAGYVQARTGAAGSGRARSTVAGRVSSTTSYPTPTG